MHAGTSNVARIPRSIRFIALVCGAFLAAAGTAGALPPVFGVADDATKFDPDGGAPLYAKLKQLAMTENRIVVYFDPNQPTSIQEQSFLDRSVPVAAAFGVRIVFAVFPRHPNAFAVDTDSRITLYANYLKLLAQRYPQVRQYILLNEPNEAAFMAPQFNATGENVSAAVALKALSAGYDALKSVSAGITVIGLGLSPEANDKTSTSPVRFLKALGAAYRTSGRTTPFMDELGLHIHPRDASKFTEKTSYQWPNVGPADLDRIKQAVWDAFDGTAQPSFQEGPTAASRVLRFKLAEIGLQVGVIASVAALYTGAENVPVADEATQASVYARLVGLFACDPTVAEALFFLLVDQKELARFQSGLLRVDGSERPAYTAVRDMIARAAQCATPKQWRHTTDVLGANATFEAADKPERTAIVGLTVTAAEDATAEAVLLPASRQPGPAAILSALRPGSRYAKARKNVQANFSPRLEFRGLLQEGAYAMGVRLTSAMNPKRTSVFVGPVFRVGRTAAARLLMPGRALEFVAPLAPALRKARAGLAVVPRLRAQTRGIDRQLAAGQDKIELGARSVTTGKICAGARAVTSGTEKLRRSREQLDGVVADIRNRLPRENSGPGGDADHRDFLWHELGYRRSLVEQVERDAQDLQQAFARLCAAVQGPRTVRAIIREIHAADHTLYLGDGTVVTLADVDYGSAFSEGLLVKATGLGMKDGTLYATDVDTIVEATKAPNPALLKCVFFRIAPAQSFAGPAYDLPPPGLTLHKPEGYLLVGKLWLEDAMRLGVERKNCPKLPLQGTGIRYSMNIELSYQDTVLKKEVTSLLGIDLTGKEAPVAFPSTIESFSDAKLVAVTRVQTCKTVYTTKLVKSGNKVKKVKVKSQDCEPPEVVDKETYTVRVHRGSYFALKYDGVETSGGWVLLDLDDNDFSTFRAVKLGGLAPILLPPFLLPGTSYEVTAQGYLVTGKSSSKPQVKTIKPGDSFAVYPIHGLSNGRVKGTRNGKPFWYTARQPRVVSDVVNFCPPLEDSYYRLPWQPGLTVKVGQGNNNPKFTHTGNGKYAFDFSLADGQTIYAPRGGVVTWVVESLSATSVPNVTPWVPANALRIEHQDGTASWYFHMQKNGVIPMLNTKVYRGSQVAITGNTGNSTGPHLHFQVQSDPTEWEPSIQIRFQTNDTSCVIPATGGEHVSNNS